MDEEVEEVEVGEEGVEEDEVCYMTFNCKP